MPADRPNLSPGCTYLGSAARYPHTEGAFARYAVLESRMLRPLPPGVDLRTAALVEPASVAWHAVSRAGSRAASADSSSAPTARHAHESSRTGIDRR